MVEGGVDAACGVDECGKRVGVGGLELGDLAVLEDLCGDGYCSDRSSRTSCAVENTLPLPYFIGLGRSILLKRTSPSCLGELMLKRWPDCS